MNRTRLLFSGLLGDRFEVRGKFKADLTGPERGGFGFVFGHPPFGAGAFLQGWYMAGVHSLQDRPVGYVRSGSEDLKMVPLPGGTSNEADFTFRLDRDRLSFSVGKTKIFDRLKLPEGELPGGEGAFGIGFIGGKRDTGTETWNCEARKLP